jgi:hypothetical protein
VAVPTQIFRAPAAVPPCAGLCVVWEGTAESVNATLDRARAKVEVGSGSKGGWPSENRFERLRARPRREPPRIHDLPVNAGVILRLRFTRNAHIKLTISRTSGPRPRRRDNRPTTHLQATGFAAAREGHVEGAVDRTGDRSTWVGTPHRFSGDVSMGDVLGSLIAMNPTPAA